MERKREYWQSIRGICILAVVLIHSVGSFDYSVGYDTEFIILRGLKLKCSGWNVLIAWAISCVEALALRKFGMSVGFYTSQITVGSFLYSATVIGWILKQLDTQRGSVKLLCKIGDCSYGIFYVHMAVLTVIGKFMQSCDWYLYWSLRFAMTLIISFTIIFAGQKILKNQTKLLRFIGFI